MKNDRIISCDKPIAVQHKLSNLIQNDPRYGLNDTDVVTPQGMQILLYKCPCFRPCQQIGKVNVKLYVNGKRKTFRFNECTKCLKTSPGRAPINKSTNN